MPEPLTEAQRLAIEERRNMMGGIGSDDKYAVTRDALGRQIYADPRMNEQRQMPPSDGSRAWPSLTAPAYVRDRTVEGGIPRLIKKYGPAYDPSIESPITAAPDEVRKYYEEKVGDAYFGIPHESRYDDMTSGNTSTANENTPAPPKPEEEQPTPAPDAPVEKTFEQQMADQRALIDSMYPKYDYNQQTPEEISSMNNADKDKERTRLLAMLALSAGITKAGGAGWENVAGGLAAAGGVYSEGFKRYQDVLEGRARMAMSRRESAYKDDFKRTELAYGSVADNLKAQREAELQWKKEILENYFDIPDLKTNEMGIVDPELLKRRDEGFRQRRQFMTTGSLYQDVADK